jgi:hypothetical protein
MTLVTTAAGIPEANGIYQLRNGRAGVVIYEKAPLTADEPGWFIVRYPSKVARAAACA